MAAVIVNSKMIAHQTCLASKGNSTIDNIQRVNSATSKREQVSARREDDLADR